jgi:TRAP-type C4-dicarboxylate transport system substrate-binding protein
MDVVLANPARLLALTADRRAWLEKAADDAAGRSADLAEREARLIQNACATGVRFAEASTENLAALADAFAPVYVDLERDAATRIFISRIRALKDSTPAEPAAVIPAGCTIGESSRSVLVLAAAHN